MGESIHTHTHKPIRIQFSKDIHIWFALSLSSILASAYIYVWVCNSDRENNEEMETFKKKAASSFNSERYAVAVLLMVMFRHF